MLKRYKIITHAPTCFGSRMNHHQGADLCLAKITEHGFSVLVGIDAVKVMAAYRPVVQAYGSQWSHWLHFLVLSGKNRDSFTIISRSPFSPPQSNHSKSFPKVCVSDSAVK